MAIDTMTIAVLTALFTGAISFLWTIYQQHQINNMCYECPFRTTATYEEDQKIKAS